MQKEKSAQLKSIKYAVLFFLLFFLAIFVALCVRLVVVFSQSAYDGAHRFTIDVIESPSTNELFSFAPDVQTISLLKVKGALNPLSLEHVIKIPIDATVESGVNDQNIPSFLFTLATHFNQFPSHGFTFIDAFRLYLYSQNVKPEAISRFSVSVANSTLNDTDQQQVAQMFIDQTLYQENVSISVVNATDSSGVGSRLAKFLTNMGGNVVSVTSGDTVQEESSIQYFGKQTYTLKKLQHILHFSLVQMQKPTISDIIVTIGENDLGSRGL